jgi:hypothetical protein
VVLTPNRQQPKALLAVLLMCLKAPPFRHLKQKTQGGKTQKSKKIKIFISLYKKHLSISTSLAISPFETKNAGSSQCMGGAVARASCP